MVWQGIVGNIPWNALVFFTLYLQLLGMSDFNASLLMVRPPGAPHQCTQHPQSHRVLGSTHYDFQYIRRV